MRDLNFHKCVSKGKKMIKYNGCRHGKYKNPRDSGLPKCDVKDCKGYYINPYEWREYCLRNNLNEETGRK